jgi:diguanylate cyclase (GGDEF)-like protein/PAS domain S-box-containing protein
MPNLIDTEEFEMKDSNMTSARILVVEDESIVALDIKHHLENMGYLVVGLAASGELAIHIAEAEKPDLVLMDIRLKGKMDGIQAAEIMRNSWDLPVLFLTAFADEPTLRRAQVTDAFGYILKPFEEHELSINIEMALYKHKMESKLRNSESRLRTIFEAAQDGIFLVDAGGKFIDVNSAGCRMFGHSREVFLQSDMRLIAFPGDQVTVLTNGHAPAGYGGSSKEYRMRHQNGSEVWVEMTLAPIHSDGQMQAIGVLRDITSRKRTLDALRESEERYSLAVQGANDGLWDWNLSKGTLYFTPRWKAMLGFAEDEIGITPEEWQRLIHPDDLVQFKLELTNHLCGLTPHFQNECRIRTKKGEYRWMLTRGVAVCDSDGVPYRMAGSQTDVTERKLAEQQLLHDAFHDALTGLPNRALFLDRLERTLERARRSQAATFAVLFMDLDRFKLVNDSMGHQAGDRLLVALTKRLQTLLRSADTLARLGGDEFVILLEDLQNPNEAEVVAEGILDELQQPFQLGGQSIFTSVSIGIVIGSADYERPADIIRDADIAMYRAKGAGKARYALFDPDLRERAITRLELEGDLRLALGRHELVVYYQPIVLLETGKVIGFEALLRWFHPVRGLIPPADFIPLAEETGLILSIGRWVLQQACHQLSLWHKQFPTNPPLTMSVNISGKQFAQADLLEQVKQILDDTGVPAQTLKMEITEYLLMENTRSVVSTLNRLRELGVQLLIDDFGTGYSSLGYVQHFPIDSIKIDRIFVNQMNNNGSQSGIAHTIIQLARGLGLGTIAEGVETADQLNRLKGMRCESGQGWLFAKAMSVEKTEAFLEEALTCGPFSNEIIGEALVIQDGHAG